MRGPGDPHTHSITGLGGPFIPWAQRGRGSRQGRRRMAQTASERWSFLQKAGDCRESNEVNITLP